MNDEEKDSREALELYIWMIDVALVLVLFMFVGVFAFAVGYFYG